MKIKTKKIVAREFLIFIVLVGISLLTFALIGCFDFLVGTYDPKSNKWVKFYIGQQDQLDISQVVLFFGLIVLYAIRPLVFAIKWSIKTMKM